MGGASSSDRTHLAFDYPYVEPKSSIQRINSDKIGSTRRPESRRIARKTPKNVYFHSCVRVPAMAHLYLDSADYQVNQIHVEGYEVFLPLL